MLDLKFVRENPDIVKQNIKNKFQDEKLPLVDEVIELDAKSRAVQAEADNLRASRNKLSKEIGKLMAQGKKEEALDFCRDWYGEEPDNTLAGAALIYCLIEAGNMDEAEEIVGRCIGENTACDDNNDVIFMAAIALCRAKGDKEREESLAGRLKIYEKEVEALLTGGLDFNGDEEWF